MAARWQVLCAVMTSIQLIFLHEKLHTGFHSWTVPYLLARCLHRKGATILWHLKSMKSCHQIWLDNMSQLMSALIAARITSPFDRAQTMCILSCPIQNLSTDFSVHWRFYFYHEKWLMHCPGKPKVSFLWKNATRSQAYHFYKNSLYCIWVGFKFDNRGSVYQFSYAVWGKARK